MSGLTLRTVLDADVDAMGGQARAWLAMAEALDNATEDLIRGSRDLEEVWPMGSAAEAAHEKSSELRAEASNGYQPCRRIGRALEEYAETVRRLKNMLKDITGEAAKAGFQVDIATGTVSAPQQMYQSAGSGAHVVAQQCNSYMWQLDGIVKQAADVDNRTLTVVNANLPDAQRGFGSLSLPPVSEAALQAQKGRPPADVHAWWESLTPQQQEHAIRDYPQLVGWLDGVPASDRNTANRLTLDAQRKDLSDDIAWYNNEIARIQRENPHGVVEMQDLANRRDQAQEQLNKLNTVHDKLRDLGDRGMLLGVDPAGDGKVIISVGNPDTARHTAVWVPGFGTTLEGSTGDNVDRMNRLQLSADQMTPEAGDVATVYWLGYDAPELDSVAFEERSRAGRDPYLNFMAGMRASYDGPGDQHLTAMGHSYGSTVVGEAAKTGRLDVDDISVAGSPGMHVDHARDLNIDPQHLWAGSAWNDPVSKPELAAPILGPVAGWLYEDGHNGSPHRESFGGNRYEVDTGFHSAYWDEGTRSLKNQAAIVVGDYAAVTLDHGQAPQENP